MVTGVIIQTITPPTAAVPVGCGRIGTMQLRIFTEPQQGADYGRQLAVARAAEELGFDAFFRSDHYLTMGERQRAARADRLLADAGRAGRADVPDPARHPGQLGHVPLPGAAGHRGGPGRRDERRPHRAWPGGGLVRGGARRLRHPVPAGRRAVRPAGRAARGDHRAVGRAGGPEVLFRRGLLPGPGLARAAQAGAAAAPADHRRRARSEPDARAGRPVRGRVQHAVLQRGADRRAVRPGPRGVPVGRP